MRGAARCSIATCAFRRTCDVTECAKTSFLCFSAVTVFVTTAGHFQKPGGTGEPAKSLYCSSLRFLRCLPISQNWIMSPLL